MADDEGGEEESKSSAPERLFGAQRTVIACGCNPAPPLPSSMSSLLTSPPPPFPFQADLRRRLARSSNVSEAQAQVCCFKFLRALV